MLVERHGGSRNQTALAGTQSIPHYSFTRLQWKGESAAAPRRGQLDCVGTQAGAEEGWNNVFSEDTCLFQDHRPSSPVCILPPDLWPLILPHFSRLGGLVPKGVICVSCTFTSAR